MGLFDKKAKEEAARAEVKQKLSQIPLLEMLIMNILEADEPWIHVGQSYYDHCIRNVIVTQDGFEIVWRRNSFQTPGNSANGAQSNDASDILERVIYSYTKSGYLPLHSYPYDDGRRELSTETVCYLWTSVIYEQMKKKMPNCKFGEVNANATFTYKVPSLSFKDWF